MPESESQFEDIQNSPSIAARREVTPEMRLQRSESRRTTTYRNFLKQLSEISGMSLDMAEKASTSVLCALEQRLTGDEVKDLESQLPAKLRDLLMRCERHEGAPPRKFGLDEFYDMVATDLGMTSGDAKPIVRQVFLAVQSQISQGEADDVASQLPKDIGRAWTDL